MAIDTKNGTRGKTTETKSAYEPPVRQTGSLGERLARVKTTRWIRFGIVTAIFVGWVAWLGSWWVLVFWFLLADIYLTQYINWGWWKYSRNTTLRTIMGWVDAIVYALILVYFLFAFVGQNYQIPSSSLEKSLLVGDYLWVNKVTYGPRVPNTPLHFPLSQNTLPILNCKSYIEWPQWEYHRLKGLRSIERYDIVVFNFPSGDTVALNVQNPDYYTLCATEPGGRRTIHNNPQIYGEVIYRPVDRREAYVKRAVGLPGETLKIVDNTVYIDGKPLPEPENVQYNYLIQTDGSSLTAADWERIGVSVDDRLTVPVNSNIDRLSVLALGLTVKEDGTVPPIYQAPLTKAMVETTGRMSKISKVIHVPTNEYINPYPISRDYGWTRADYGEIWIPKKGESIELTMDNLALYERPIRNYEGNTLEVRDGQILINGQVATSYTFKMDYYWMMGDNRDNSADSRYWGFVPEDHVIGTPVFILVSFDKDRSFPGIRWERVFHSAVSDKDLLDAGR